MLLAISHTFADCADDITGFADSNTDLAFFIADDNDGSEAHLFAALNCFGYAADLHHAFLPFGVALLSATVATAATATITAATATALLLLLLLAFGRGRNISRARHGVGIGLGGGIGHG